MAIQLPNPGLGDGQTGDNEFVMWTKVKDNFSNASHAASRLVGTSFGNVMEVKAFGLGYTVQSHPPTTATSPEEIPAGFFTTANESPLKPDGMLGTFDNIGIKIAHTVGSAGGYMMFPYHIGGNANIVYTAYRRTGGVLETRVFKIYSNQNTTIVNGNLKPSSPVVKIHTDSLELNDDAERMGVTLNKRGVGDYLLQNTTGLRKDDGWYIELPQDVNGNPYFAVTYEQLENNDIEVKTYKRIFDMNTFMFVPDLDSPIDIKEGRSIAIRFNDLPADILDDTQTEV